MLFSGKNNPSLAGSCLGIKEPGASFQAPLQRTGIQMGEAGEVNALALPSLPHSFS